jgi:hypothetical protein
MEEIEFAFDDMIVDGFLVKGDQLALRLQLVRRYPASKISG